MDKSTLLSQIFTLVANGTTAPANVSARDFRHISLSLNGFGTILTYGALVGVFVAGETITGGTSGATATIVTDNGLNSMTITNVSGTFTVGETITGGTSGATATVATYVLPAFTVRVKGSLQGNGTYTPPNFALPSTPSNSWQYVQLKDNINNTFYNGNVGYVFAANGTALLEINTNILTWVALEVSARTAGTLVAQFVFKDNT